ncbi:hypothetical protein COU54_04590 [Candidatus Pacearchaeota archaeon CG10_big_fil_rev_8_21_14_0_10_31_24]|nr:MAG: hypothetical protein COU54_04590 [Candidatus Pacearchaeota archaeon CG10_big_fil_rev_8_21_14_0_10_31_24]
MPRFSPETKYILKKYSSKIEKQMSQDLYSKEYIQFKKDTLPEISKYEKWAKSLGNIIKIKVAEKDKIKIENHLNAAHIDVTPSQALTLSIMALLTTIFLSFLASLAIFFITDSVPLLFFFLGFIASIFIFYYTYTFPERLANAWKLSASSQMVPAILYLVVYMKHTSNLERAIKFAAQHLEGPLALDLNKIFYDVEIGKFSTIKQALDSYLECWSDYSPEFVEAMHLIESSLYESSENRRIQTLEKSLQIILDGVYEKMLKYSREIRSPLTNIYMLGIILPTLALALLPLASTLLGGLIKWYHILILFNLIIPFFVWYLTTTVLLKRPGGHGESSILELNPQYETYTSRKPWISSLWILIPLILIGTIPFLFQISAFTSSLGLKSDYTFGELGLPFLKEIKLFEFKCSTNSVNCLNGNLVGPFGLLGIVLSLFIPLGIGLYISRVYYLKTNSLIQSREDTKILEQEFTNSLFQLSNRLGDGIPAEIAFARVASSTKGQKTQSFFALVNQNVQQMGMSLESAIFDRKRGAIIYYPSALISTSMKILIESVKKGLRVAAQSLMSISEYVKNIQKINNRLKDLLAEIVSDMKSNMTFLAPLLSGIVVGLAAMITSILSKLENLSDVAGSTSGIGSLSNILEIFKVKEMIPPYFLQIVIGIYIIQIIIILTKALVTIDSAKDSLREKNETARYLKVGLLLYLATALISTIALTLLSSLVLTSVG